MGLERLRLGEQYLLHGRLGREAVGKAHRQCTGAHEKKPGRSFAAHSNHRTFTSRSAENSNEEVRGVLLETITGSYRPPFEARLGTVIEPGACPRHDYEAEDKGQHDHQPGKFSEPVPYLSPPRQMTYLVERVA